MKDHYTAQVAFLDRKIDWLKRSQCMRADDKLYGAVQMLVPRHRSAQSEGVKVASSFILAYYTPQSAYYHQDDMLVRAQLALLYAEKLQNADGTLDLEQTNFHDAAETAFAVNAFYPAYTVMQHLNGHTKPEDELDRVISRFLNKAADGIIQGGFHTPNHRWVISAAMASLARLIERPECLDYMKLFLNEGIDCDAEGEFTERSAGVYNIVCDKSLFVLANERYMPELYGHITRNLNMVMQYFEPDGHINTMNSTRQDKGMAPEADIYYDCFLAMALKTRDAGFAYMADRMLETLAARACLDKFAIIEPFSFMHLFLLDDALIAEQREILCRKPNLNYDHYFKSSGIVRYRRNDFTMTLVKDMPQFIKLQYERHTVFVRLAGSFYARGQFVAQKLEQIGSSYHMSFHDRWGYKRPLSTPQNTSDWRKMDHSKRESVSMQDFDLYVDITPTDNGAQLHVRSAGCENVPVKLEFILEPDGHYCSNDVEMVLRKGAYLYQKCTDAVYQYDDHRELHIVGGCFAHAYGENMRGTLPGEAANACIALTAYTPFETAVSLTFN